MNMRNVYQHRFLTPFLITCLLNLVPIRALSLIREKVEISQNALQDISRRDLVHWSLLAAAPLILPAFAVAEEVRIDDQGLLSTTDVANLLRSIPTFAIVDKKGVPFMVVGEDAKVTGYFFTSWKEASRILALAKTSAEKSIAAAKKERKSQEEVGMNPWKNARISSIPLDSAMTLVYKSSASKRGGFYFKIAPAEDDIEDALVLTGKDDLAEGRVPLFYYADFTVDVDGRKRTPLYFRTSELEDEFKRLNPNTDPPKIVASELLALLAELVKPGGTDSDLKSLVFMAPKESEKRRKECEKAGGKEAPFVIGQRIIVL